MDSGTEIGDGENLRDGKGKGDDQIASGRKGEYRIRTVIDDQRDGGWVVEWMGEGDKAGFRVEIMWGFSEREDEVDGVLVADGSGLPRTWLSSDPFKEGINSSSCCFSSYAGLPWLLEL